jgi:hypothetical protein
MRLCKPSICRGFPHSRTKVSGTVFVGFGPGAAIACQAGAVSGIESVRNLCLVLRAGQPSTSTGAILCTTSRAIATNQRGAYRRYPVRHSAFGSGPFDVSSSSRERSRCERTGRSFPQRDRYGDRELGYRREVVSVPRSLQRSRERPAVWIASGEGCCGHPGTTRSNYLHVPAVQALPAVLRVAERLSSAWSYVSVLSTEPV